MHQDCASRLCFTLTRPHILFSAGIIVTFMHTMLPSKPLPMLFSVNKLQQRHIPFNHLWFQTTEHKRVAWSYTSNKAGIQPKKGTIKCHRKNPHQTFLCASSSHTRELGAGGVTAACTTSIEYVHNRTPRAAGQNNYFVG